MISPASIEIRELILQDPHYPESLELRRQVLMTPIGITYHEGIAAMDAQSRHFAAFLDGEMVGAVLLMPHADPGKWRLRQMAVRPDVQGMGIGRLLVGHAENWARKQGIGEIILHARVHAQGFYQKLGYRVRGEAFKEVGIDHRIMIKNLLGGTEFPWD